MRNSLLIGIITMFSFQSCKVTQTNKINEPFEVVLEKEGVGGYQWHYIAIPEVIKLDSTSVAISEKDKLDRYSKKFTLKGIKTGRYKLEFHLLRSFEKIDTVPKEYIKIIKVKIKK